MAIAGQSADANLALEAPRSLTIAASGSGGSLDGPQGHGALESIAMVSIHFAKLRAEF
jgi:hypothetical protein